MNHAHAARFAAPTLHSVARTSSSPPPEAMDFARAAEPRGFDVPRQSHGSEPLAQAASPLPAVKPPTPEPSQAIVHEAKRAPAEPSQGAQGGSGLGVGLPELSDVDLILMHHAHHDATRHSSSSGWDACFEFLDRSTSALLRDCGALYRSAGERCTELGAWAGQCESPALTRGCAQLSQAGHELWAGFGQCCNSGLGLCESILKCPVTTCSALCESLGQISCPSCPSCSCDCNCGDCDCGDCGGCD